MIIVETGVGVRGANVYVNSAYVTNYLTVRNRQTENGWNAASDVAKDAAVISATDYIDKRFGHRFRGVPAVTFDETFATAELLFSGQPDPTEELNLGNDLYEFVSSLSGRPWEVLIGASPFVTAANLAAAVNGGAGAGASYGLGTPQSRHAGAALAGAVLTLTARAPGSSGPLTVLEGPVTNVAVSGWVGGLDGGIQPLCWPRSYSYDQQGNAYSGIPDRLKQAVAEYAVRALGAMLVADQASDAIGVVSKTETVGPITESFRYSSAVSFVAYPAADKLISPLLLGSGQGRVIRG